MAECFNFYFPPQELDEEFLVVWDGFSDPPWESRSEPELRKFLLERVQEGYTFPVNPVWPVRDPGWFEVLGRRLLPCLALIVRVCLSVLFPWRGRALG